MTEDNPDYSSNTSPPGHFDTAETVQISGIALLKMLKNAHSGIPSEVCGLILGRFIDDYTVNVVDVFSMPPNPTNYSASVDDPYKSHMCSLLKKVSRTEEVIGWYKSHPGTGIWLSGVDVNTQMQWEKTNQRCIAIVIDPVQSVKGKVVIGAFRLISQYSYNQSEECRETTSFIGHLEKPTAKALVRNLNRQYYSMPIVYKMSLCEQQMLMSLNRPDWMNGFEIKSFVESDKKNLAITKKLNEVAPEYRHSIIDEEGMSKNELLARHIGKVDPEVVVKNETNEIAQKEYQHLIRLHHNTNSF